MNATKAEPFRFDPDDPFDRVRLFHDDAVRALSSIASDSVDVVLTDPPFSSGSTSEAGVVRNAGRGRMMLNNKANGDWFESDNLTKTGAHHLIRSVALEAKRILVPGGHLLVFIDWRMFEHFRGAIESAGLRPCSTVIWDKGSIGPGVHFRRRHEFVLHFAKGKPRDPFARDVGDIVKHARIPGKRKIHPTEKPVALLRDLLRPTCPPGGVVVDPFSGSGSTGAAALAHGARAILVERDRKYVDRIAARLALDPADLLTGPGGEAFEAERRSFGDQLRAAFTRGRHRYRTG